MDLNNLIVSFRVINQTTKEVVYESRGVIVPYDEFLKIVEECHKKYPNDMLCVEHGNR